MRLPAGGVRWNKVKRWSAERVAVRGAEIFHRAGLDQPILVLRDSLLR
jgi:hypothetical protein